MIKHKKRATKKRAPRTTPEVAIGYKPYTSPEDRTGEDAQFDESDAQDGLRHLSRAAKIRKNPKYMAAIKKHARAQQKLHAAILKPNSGA